MKSAWLVTSGDYSDYHVDSAWSTEALAKKRAALIGADVEEFPFDSLPTDRLAWLVKLQPGKTALAWHQDYEADFKGHKVGFLWDSCYGDRGELHRVEVQWRDGRFSGTVTAAPYFQTIVTAETEEHAKKVARERLAELVVRGDWDRFVLNPPKKWPPG